MYMGSFQSFPFISPYSIIPRNPMQKNSSPRNSQSAVSSRQPQGRSSILVSFVKPRTCLQPRCLRRLRAVSGKLFTHWDQFS